jgi:pimeloyl-ACP methyl ester carboxylesterase
MDRASRRSVLLVLGSVYGALTLFPALGAAILLPVAETWRGRVYATAVFCLLALPPLIVRARILRGRSAIGLAVGVGASFGVLLFVLYAASPDGRPLAGSPLRSEFLGDARYRRSAVATLLPEIDQVKLATYVAPAIDPIIDHAAGRRIRDMTMPKYRAMESDPEFAALGTVLADAYADRDAAHLFAYAPSHDSAEHLPMIVFLHGSAGNFKAYFYLWKRFADRTGMIVVCPSFGFGNWNQPGGIEAIERARAWAIATLGADASRVFLVGLSNGGTGVTRGARANPGAYRGLVFISGVVEEQILLRAGKDAEAGGLRWPMLFIHGDRDDRIPLQDVTYSTTRLRAHGAIVDEWFLDDEDHFLFFHRDNEVLDRIADWVKHIAQ